MIPEREREALMRLTMCAREECSMCKYEEQCDNWDFRMELATKNMNILADALRKTESSSEKPNFCEDLQDWKDRMWAEAIVTEPTTSKMEQVDEPQTEPLQTCSVNGRPYSECSSCEHFKCTADEPQTEVDWKDQMWAEAVIEPKTERSE